MMIETKRLGYVMKHSIAMVTTAITALVALSQAATVEAADIKVLSANGMREVMQDLGPKFERATGHRRTIAFATLGVIVQRTLGGEAADLVFRNEIEDVPPLQCSRGGSSGCEQ
jgi:ABC-type molybdate transport system substrate-binding protein